MKLEDQGRKSEKTKTADNRNSPRKTVRIPCAVTFGNIMVPARILDLSAGGAFVQCREELDPGSEITLTFDLAIRKDIVEYNINAVVAHTGRFIQAYENFKGFGVRFLKLSEDIRVQLKDALSEAKAPTYRKYAMY